jgi:hypothetical protein
VERNEFVTTSGPKIEIVLWDDRNSYFQFAKPAYYLPYLESKENSGATSSGTKNQSGGTTSWEVKTTPKSQVLQKVPPTTKSPWVITSSPKKVETSPYQVQPGEWENF